MMDPNEALFDFAEDDTKTGFRLQRLEVYNWGTFNKRVQVFTLDGRNALLTGEIGSGKSTLVDAVTTLLVPAHRIAYNKAAGAGNRERDLRSYVLGYYKSERGDEGLSSRAVALRGAGDYSVILGIFHNEGYGQTTSLAQVFWQKDLKGQPARFHVVSSTDLSISRDFSGFGSDISALKKQLKTLAGTELFDDFRSYSMTFRRIMGLQNEQALELFHQTVSMKSVGDLTDFVRRHMLEAFDSAPKIDALIHHFDDLDRAHEAILRAREQIARLRPLVSDLDRLEEERRGLEHNTLCRNSLSTWFRYLEKDLLEGKLSTLLRARQGKEGQLSSVETDTEAAHIARDELKASIASQGGDALDRLRSRAISLERDRVRLKENWQRYEDAREQTSLPEVRDAETFEDNRARAQEALESLGANEEALQNRLSDIDVGIYTLRKSQLALQDELESLRGRESNIPREQVDIRSKLVQALDLVPEDLPFCGELLRIKAGEEEWEGAAERVMRSFALSLLVPDTLYERVSAWVDTTNLRGLLVYYRVREQRYMAPADIVAGSLASKLDIRPTEYFDNWLRDQLARRFDYQCCRTLEDFRRHEKALSPSGQMKDGGIRHEKDDRHKLHDKSRYVLGWSNREKIRLLEEQSENLGKDLALRADERNRCMKDLESLREKREAYVRLDALGRFEDIDWQGAALELDQVQKEIARIEKTSNILQELSRQLVAVEEKLSGLENKSRILRDDISRLNQQIEDHDEQLSACVTAIAESGEERTVLDERLTPLKEAALGDQEPSLKNRESLERSFRTYLQGEIDNANKRMTTLTGRISAAMQGFRNAYPLESREMDESIEAGDEYRNFLSKLEADDLPSFQTRFKTLLNENTIREVANFRAQLDAECTMIRERIERINRSLSAINYNPGRYIVLQHQSSTDAEIRDFRSHLRSCTEGSLGEKQDELYSEQKFLLVKEIIQRFRGREGFADADKRWMDKVSDVRNWFVFAASERWREDDSEFEHYTDSGGKSGGQKEKLAYTILAASLAYQFGLERGETRSRSFRFVMIDEAFGRGSDESSRYGLRLFKELNLQLLIVTPMQKIHIIEPFVHSVGFICNEDGRESRLQSLSIEAYRARKESAVRERTSNADDNT